MGMRYADVIVPLAVDGMYTYSIPAALEETVAKGSLVIVSFAGNKKYTGIVCLLHENNPVGYDTKPIEGLVEERVRFSDVHLKFLLWVSEYYMAMPGEVMKAALPVAFRLESFVSIARCAEVEYEGLTAHETALLNFLRVGEYVALKEAEKSLKIKNGVQVVKSLLNKGFIQVKETVDDIFKEKTVRIVKWAESFGEAELHTRLDSLKRAPVQYNMLCRWIERGEKEMERSEFLSGIGESAAALKALCGKNILTVEERITNRPHPEETDGGDCNDLSDKQQQALEDICTAYESKDCVLLQGVTSSGKTEVYIHLIKKYIGQGFQALYMLPEIALTVQIIRRLQRVFGDNIGIYHSGMPDSVRAEMWRKQCGPQPYKLVVGVRSSVFLPFDRLGLIIVDEEHENSYKQKEPAPRYNGRDTAIMLARMFGAKILLGSATPSFETYHNALDGKYGHVKLESRFGNVRMPELLLVDIGEYKRKKMMDGSFSPVLIQEMKRVLDAGMQVILFQNRRGYSTYVQCDTCGAIPKCRNCDVSMTYYKKRDVLSCHYCGSLKKASAICESCGVGHYREKTPGTERIEEEVGRLFPQSRVARMDMEVMNSKRKYQAVIDDFERGETDILIGTQMVSKGLDFEKVKLVGVIDADSMVHFPDFRAEERAYSMLLQVSGRSGRKGEQGRVVIQVSDMENRVYTMLTNGSYGLFFSALAAERELFAYPPYGRLIQVELRHKEAVVIRNAANELAGRLRRILGKRVCGPAVPEVGKISGMNRIQFILKIEHGASFSKIKLLLKQEFALLRQNKIYGALRIFCDVDPG